MTTFPVPIPEDAGLEAALTKVIAVVRPCYAPAVAAAQEIRNCAAPGNGVRVAAVPYGPVRVVLVRAMREVAAGCDDRVAGLVNGLADRLADRLYGPRGNRPVVPVSAAPEA
jgi:hypothetical protein